MKIANRYTSVFGALRPVGFTVIQTNPAGTDWFVTVDDTSMQPIWESEIRQECEDVARWNMQASDLAFVAKNARDCDHPYRLYAGSDLRKSSDGLSLHIDRMVVAQTDVHMTDGFMATIKGFNPDWAEWVRFREFGTAMEGADGCESVILEFDVNPDPKASPDDSRSETALVMLNFGGEYGSRFSSKESSGVGLCVLNPSLEIEHGLSLRDFLRKFGTGYPMQVMSVSDQDEFATHEKFLEEKLPLYFSAAKEKPELRESAMVLEGGEALKILARSRPWMVEKNADGQALPLRITKPSVLVDGLEEGAERDAQFISSLVMRDELTRIVRAKVIEKQQSEDVTFEQTLSDGRKFTKVAHVLGADLEVAYEKTTPNIIGTRDWGCYRLWVEGELVLDVSPANKAMHQTRIASLSPMTGSIWNDPNWSGEAVGELLSIALIEIGAGDDESSIDYTLPQRVQDFLSSAYAEDLRSAAQDMEQGGFFVNGRYVNEPTEQHEDEGNALSL